MKIIIFLITFIALVLYACTAQTSSGNYENIDVTTFKEKMADESVVILDVRTPKEIAAGKIAGALEMDYKANDFQEQLAKLDKDKTYLIYCASGGRSSRTCSMLDKQGFTELYNLNGGYQVWKATQ